MYVPDFGKKFFSAHCLTVMVMIILQTGEVKTNIVLYCNADFPMNVSLKIY